MPGQSNASRLRRSGDRPKQADSRPHRALAKINVKRLTEPNPGLYCAPSQVKGDFRDFPAVDGIRNRATLGSSPWAFVAPGHSLKIRIGNLCGDSRHCAFGAIDDEFPKRPVVHS